MRITLIIETSDGPAAHNQAHELAQAVNNLDMTECDFDIDSVFIVSTEASE